MVSECATFMRDIERDDNPSLGDKAKPRELRNRSASEICHPHASSKGTGYKKKRPTARSILSSVLPSRISKVAGKKSFRPREARNISHHAPQCFKKATIDGSRKQTSTFEDSIPARDLRRTPLRPIHSGSVSKARRKVSGRGQAAEPLNLKDTKVIPRHNGRRNKQERRPGKSSAPLAGPRLTKRPASDNTPVRRSKRISQKPERFCAGYT